LPESAGAARVQISVVARLVDSLARSSAVSPAAIVDVKRAITYARHELERRSAASAPDEHATQIPHRLLRKPGTEW
jgi:hypothetical protein